MSCYGSGFQDYNSKVDYRRDMQVDRIVSIIFSTMGPYMYGLQEQIEKIDA